LTARAERLSRALVPRTRRRSRRRLSRRARRFARPRRRWEHFRALCRSKAQRACAPCACFFPPPESSPNNDRPSEQWSDSCRSAMVESKRGPFDSCARLCLEHYVHLRRRRAGKAAQVQSPAGAARRQLQEDVPWRTGECATAYDALMALAESPACATHVSWMLGGDDDDHDDDCEVCVRVQPALGLGGVRRAVGMDNSERDTLGC
jgi:hypothetical protein